MPKETDGGPEFSSGKLRRVLEGSSGGFCRILPSPHGRRSGQLLQAGAIYDAISRGCLFQNAFPDKGGQDVEQMAIGYAQILADLRMPFPIKSARFSQQNKRRQPVFQRIGGVFAQKSGMVCSLRLSCRQRPRRKTGSDSSWPRQRAMSTA